MPVAHADAGNSGVFDVMSALDTIRELDFIRVCGSEGERRGMDVVTRQLDGIGVGWHYHAFRDRWLEADDPHVLVRGREIAVRPALELSFQHGVSPEACDRARVDLQAELGPVGDCAGKIAVVERFDWEKPIERDAVAQLMAFRFDPAMEPFIWAAQEDGARPVPTAVVVPEHIPEVLAALGEQAAVRWSARIVEREFRNLIVEIPGGETPDEIVAMGAHIDTFPGTVGSSDDAAGCAVLVEAARWFAAHRPARTVRLLWFTGEEVDARGSRAYIRECVADPCSVKLMVNVDSSCEMHTGPFTLYASDESIVKWARQSLDLGDMEHFITKGGGTDARSFIESGIPSFAVEAPCKQSAHLPDDDPQHIDPQKLQILGSLSLSASIHAACAYTL